MDGNRQTDKFSSKYYLSGKKSKREVVDKDRRKEGYCFLDELTFVGTIDDLDVFIEFLQLVKEKHTKSINWYKEHEEDYYSLHTHYSLTNKALYDESMPELTILTVPEDE